MILNNRKNKILEAIINDYIQTAEPVGSRTIAKRYDFGISSATIRNEMSDLEDMGLIVQPHASAGRVPSDKGYRLYVDNIRPKKTLTKDEAVLLRQMVVSNINHMDFLMQELAKAISILTNYTTIVAEPNIEKTKIKHVQVLPLDDYSIVLTLVTDSKSIKNHVIKVNNAPDYLILSELSLILNKNLIDASLEDINDSLVKKITKSSDHNEILAIVLDKILNTLSNEDYRQIYTSGMKNILSFPEFSNPEKAGVFFQALEEKKMLITLLGNEDDVKVVIGSENNMEQMKECSVIRATYKKGNKDFGNIAIVGPTRMDYSQVISILGDVADNIYAILDALSGG